MEKGEQMTRSRWMRGLLLCERVDCQTSARVSINAHAHAYVEPNRAAAAELALTLNAAALNCVKADVSSLASLFEPREDAEPQVRV